MSDLHLPLVAGLARVLVRWMLHDTGDNQWFTMAMPCGANQVAVHPSDELKRYFLGAHRFTLAMIRAAAEEFGFHRGYHADGSLVALRLTLRKRVEVREFRGGEEHGSCVRTSSDASATADASGRIEGSIRGFLWYQDRIGIRSASRGRADEASRLNDSIKRRAVNHQVSDHREGPRAPRVQRERVTILEKAHRQLAHRRAPMAAVSHTVDQEAA